jgi:hypothetical protein
MSATSQDSSHDEVTKPLSQEVDAEPVEVVNKEGHKLNDIYDRMIDYMRDLSQREPCLEQIIKPFFSCKSLGVFLAVFSTEEDIEPLIDKKRWAIYGSRDNEIKKLIDKLLAKYNLSRSQFDPQDIDKIGRYLNLWAEVIS